MAENLKSRHAFGSESGVDQAIADGLIDAYDILFLSEGKIGWIDKDGNKVILEDKTGVVSVSSLSSLPEVGNDETVYICDSKLYVWNGSDYVTSTASGMDETAVETKVHEALEAANAYTDKQIANAVSTEVVEF